MKSIPPGSGQAEAAAMFPFLLSRVAGHPLTWAGWGQLMRGAQTQRIAWWPITSVHSVSALPMVSALECQEPRESGKAIEGAGAAGGVQGKGRKEVKWVGMRWQEKQGKGAALGWEHTLSSLSSSLPIVLHRGCWEFISGL